MPKDEREKPASVDLHFRVPATQYDAAYTAASLQRLTVPEWIRRALEERLRQKLDRG